MFTFLAFLSLISCFTKVSFKGTDFLIFPLSEGKSRPDAIKYCQEQKGNLVSIYGSKESEFLASNIKTESYLASWDGNDYEKKCLVFWPGSGAVTEPKKDSGDCNTKRGFICELDGHSEASCYYKKTDQL